MARLNFVAALALAFSLSSAAVAQQPLVVKPLVEKK